MLICIDNETEMISQSRVVPSVICAGVAFEESRAAGISTLVVTAHERTAYEAWKSALETCIEGKALMVNQSVKFDLSTAVKTWPDLLPLVFQAFEAESITCLTVREKLLNLSSHGKITQAPNPDGSFSQIYYSLKDLAYRYLGEDLSEDKDQEDSWRVNYSSLEGLSLDEYPDEAVEYVEKDCKLPIEIYWAQEDRLHEAEGLSVETQFFQTAVDFCLCLMTSHGMAVDSIRVGYVEELLQQELNEDKIGILTEVGILRPAKPPRPYKNNPNKFTQGKPPSKNMKVLRKWIKDFCQEHNIEVKLTDKGQISTSSEFIQDLLEADESNAVLIAYQQRQDLSMLVNNYMPKLKEGHEIRANFNVLVETGRTSSSGSARGKRATYLAWNGQNVDPRIRPCCIAHDGWAFCSVDYSANELVSLAQTCLSLFGYSVMADQVNAGRDLHAYLGAQIALAKWEDFRELCKAEGFTDRTQVYEAFMEFKGDAEFGQTWKRYRTLAKPTGLGFPGGLGPDTFVRYAKATYGVVITREEAEQLRELWLETYPEMVQYFAFVNKELPDPLNQGKYAYVSPYGMVRRGASYCAAANGLGLQTPTADGGKMAVWLVTRACYDPSVGSVLYNNCRPLLFIHDELFCEVRDNGDKALRHALALEISSLMEEAMRTVVTDVVVRAEPALMRRWWKQAEAIYDKDGLLDIWEAKEE